MKRNTKTTIPIALCPNGEELKFNLRVQALYNQSKLIHSKFGDIEAENEEIHKTK